MTRYHLALLALVALGFLTAMAIVLIGSARPLLPPVRPAGVFGEEYVAPPDEPAGTRLLGQV